MRTWLDAWCERLSDAPQERTVSAFPDVLRRITGERRIELLATVQQALGTRIDLLGVLADALFDSDWPGAELASVRVYLGILEQDSQHDGAAQGIAGALGYVSEYEAVRPLLEHALTITDDDPQLVTPWAEWLRQHDRENDADNVAAGGLSRWLEQLAHEPHDERLISAIAGALSFLSEYEVARPFVDQALTITDDDPQLIASWAAWLRHHDRENDADEVVVSGVSRWVAQLTDEPHNERLVSAIAGALSFLSEYEVARPLVDQTLTVTDHDPQLVASWAEWLRHHDRDNDADNVVALGVSRWVDQLADAPRVRVVFAIPGALEGIAGKRRAELLGSVQRALGSRIDLLRVLADGLFSSNWPGAELASMRVYLQVLEQDSQNDDAVRGIADALSYVSEYEEVRPLLDQALIITDHDPQLVTSWAEWLRQSDRDTDAGDAVVHAVAAWVEQLKGAQPREQVVSAFPGALERIAAERRGELLETVQRALGSRIDLLRVLADGLFLSNWPGAELASMRVYLQILEQDSQNERAAQGIADALSYVSDYEEVRPLVDHALTITDHDPQLVTSWAEWLRLDDGETDAKEVAASALSRWVERLTEAPDDERLTSGISSALSFLSDYEVVGALVDQALTITGRDPQLAQSWADWLLNARRPRDAEDVVLDGLQAGEAWPFVARSYISVVDFYTMRSHFAEAEQWLDRIVVAVPEDPAIAVQRAHLGIWRDQPQRHLDGLSEMMTSSAINDEDRRDLLAAYADCMSALGRQTEAIARIQDESSPQHGHWESDIVGRLARSEQLARLAISIHELNRAREHIEAAETVSRESPVIRNQIIPLRLAVEALAGQLETGRSPKDPSVADLRESGRLVAIAGAAYALPLRELAARRADSDESQGDAAHFEFGNELGRVGRYWEAIAEYERSRIAWNGPTQSEAYWPYALFALHNIASAHENIGDYPHAAERWRDAAAEYERYPADLQKDADGADSPYIAWARSSAYQRLDRIGEAFRACTNGLKVDPDQLDLLSRIIDLGRDWEESRARRAAERRNNAEPHPGATSAEDTQILLTSDWLIREAVRRRRRLLEERASGSRNPRHYADLGEFLLDRSEHDAARVWIQKAIDADADEASYHVVMGRCYLATKAADRALEQFTQALALEPKNHETQSLLGDAEAQLGNRDAALANYAESLTRAPAHVPTLISLANLYVDMSEGEREGYHLEQAIGYYESVLMHHRNGTGSKFLTSSEMAAIHYQQGYCRVGLYERSARLFGRPVLLSKAREDFKLCLTIEPRHEKALRAAEKLAEKAPGRKTMREKVAPWVVVGCALVLFVFAQIRFYWFNTMSEVTYLAVSLGAIALTIAGLVLPELLKLKVGGVELEKGTVEQSAPTSFGLRR